MFSATDFYPTPRDLAHKLVAPYKLNQYSKVLDPQGGSGQLLEAAKTSGMIDKMCLHTVELDPVLNAALVGQGYVVLGNDFLQFHSDIQYDFVFSNPPFSSQEDHILHAWEYVKAGGSFAFIASSKLLKYGTPKRELIRGLQGMYGDAEPEVLQGAFSDAERKTDVEVVIMRWSRPENEAAGIFEGLDLEAETHPDFSMPESNELITRNFLDAQLQIFESYKRTAREYVLVQRKLTRISNMFMNLDRTQAQKDEIKRLEAIESEMRRDYYLENKAYEEAPEDDKPEYDYNYHQTRIEKASRAVWKLKTETDLKVRLSEEDEAYFAALKQSATTPEDSYGAMVAKTTALAWKRLIRKLGMHRHMTTDVEKEFNELTRSTSRMAFTRHNIEAVMSNFAAQVGNIKKMNVVQAHDYIRQFSKKNESQWFGNHDMRFKTNDAYKVNQKFIVPGGTQCNDYGRGDCWSWNTWMSCTRKLRDIHMAMEQLSGVEAPNVVDEIEFRMKALTNDKSLNYRDVLDTEFFEIKFFKKGTVHFKFKDKFLWQQFNITAAEGKNWIGN